MVLPYGVISRTTWYTEVALQEDSRVIILSFRGQTFSFIQLFVSYHNSSPIVPLNEDLIVLWVMWVKRSHVLDLV